MPPVRRFELVGDGHSKFWEISQTGSEVTVHFGRIGTEGQTQARDVGSWEEAAERVRKLVAEKLREGYVEVEGSGPRPSDLPGFRRPPALPPLELPLLPEDGPLTLGGVKLPNGRRLKGDPHFKPMGVEPVEQPVIWATESTVRNAGRALYELRQAAAAVNLVPVLLSGLDSEPNRPWDPAEFCPTDPRRAILFDVAAELANSWTANLAEGDDEALAVVRPFGRQFPGMAAAPSDLRRISDDRDILDKIRDRRLALVAADRPADVVAAIGWTGAVNAHEDPALLSAVLRSWEVRWKARVVAMGFATLTLTVGNPPRDEKAALAVAAEHFALCPDNIWQGSLDTMTAYAAHLRDNRMWEFWWD